MSSGTKQMQINTLEQALSSDINRLQSFTGYSLTQLLFNMFGKYNDRDDWYPGVETDPVAAAAPPYHGIIRGLRPYPVAGTTSMLVTPGMAAVENAPGGVPHGVDDSAFFLIDDPGVASVGTLLLTPGSTATRIDVIECAAADTVLESDNRNIYNITTGLFTPASVTKVKAGTLVYRIRIGTPGGGSPGFVAGWIPLAVTSVTSTATTWDDCILWDVRRLVSEYWASPYRSILRNPEIASSHMTAAETAAGTPYGIKLYGNMNGRAFEYRLDGIFENHPEDATYISITDTTTNQEPGFTLVANRPWHLYLAFPSGAPWRQYRRITSPRVPYGIPGIPIVSMTPPGVAGLPQSPLALPTLTGLGGFTSTAVCVAAGIVDGSVHPHGFSCDGRMTHLKSSADYINATVPFAFTGAYESKYVLPVGLHFPPTARRVRLHFFLDLRAAGGAVTGDHPVMLNPVVYVQDPAGTYDMATVPCPTVAGAVLNGTAQTVGLHCTVDIPIVRGQYLYPTNIRVDWYLYDGSLALDTTFSDVVKVIGWDLTG